jgi:hypothetical protein
VTHDLAVNAVRQQERQRAREQEAATMQSLTDAHADALSADQRQQLHEQLRALPDRYRGALVLCYLEGEPQDEAARRLGVNAAAFRKRLERARELLRQRLVRRGVAVGSTGALTALLAAEAGAATLPASFVVSTVQTVTAAGLAGSVTTGVITLGGIIMQTKTVLVVAATAIVLIGGTVYWTARRQGPSPLPAVPATVMNRPPAMPPPLTAEPPLNQAAPVPPPSLPADPKYAHPQQACATLLLAFASRDPAALAEAIAAPTPQRKATFCRIMPVMYAIADFSQASLTKFGETQVDRQSLYWQGDRLKEWLAFVPQALVNVTSDTATVDFTKLVDGQHLERLPLGTMLEFRRVNGEWKFWVAHEPNRKEVRMAEHADKLAPAFRELIREVEEGRYASASELRQAKERTAEAVITAVGP